jgi:hypothetical protein
MGGGGAAHLIGHDAEGFTGRCLGGMEPQHREAEVFTHWPIHPAGAQHPGSWKGQGGCFARRFGGPIDPQWIERLIRLVRRSLGAVEHEIGAHLK